jgi:hypothetical protein
MKKNQIGYSETIVISDWLLENHGQNVIDSSKNITKSESLIEIAAL